MSCSRASLVLVALTSLSCSDDVVPPRVDLSLDRSTVDRSSLTEARSPDRLVIDQPRADRSHDTLKPDQSQPDQSQPDLPGTDLAPPRCDDLKLNGAETDVDCGGGTCPGCGEGKLCKNNQDCASSLCSGGKCLAPLLTIKDTDTVGFESISNVNQVASINGTALQLSTGASTPFAAGDEVLLINLQGTDTDTGSVGNYELFHVLATTGGNVIVDKAPTKSYGNAGSNTSLTGQKVFLIKVPRFSTLTIAGKLTAKPWEGVSGKLGVIALRATVKLTVTPTGAILASHLGYRSPSSSPNWTNGKPGESIKPQPSAPSGAPNVGGGGGGAAGSEIGAGGGGGGYGSAGTAGTDASAIQLGGQGGTTYGQADLSKLYLGSGGGAGGGGNSGPGTFNIGGAGGGIILLLAPVIELQGEVAATGQVGGDNTCTILHGGASGGGGSGGSILVSGQTVTLAAAKVTALGGAGGCIRGGGGGVGRIRINCITLNGASCPGANANLTVPPAFLAAP